MKLGVAFAGGGLKGVAYIGAIKAFEELGVKFDYVSGTSSGSMTTALYAAGFSCEEMKELIYKSYRIIYYVTNSKDIYILKILHHSQNILYFKSKLFH